MRLKIYAVVGPVSVFRRAPSCGRPDGNVSCPGSSILVLVEAAEENPQRKLDCSVEFDLERPVEVDSSVGVDIVIWSRTKSRPTPAITVPTADVAVRFTIDDRATKLPAIGHALVEDEFHRLVLRTSSGTLVKRVNGSGEALDLT